MTNNEAYWTERALKRAEEAYLHDAALTAKLFQEYESAAKAIKREISAFYSKYAGKYGLTYDQAVRLLNRKEFQEWKASLAEYVDYIATIQDPKVKALLTAQLDALSANSSISRLEALQGQIDLILNDLFDKGVAQMKNQFGDDFVEGYYKKCYDLQSRAGFFNEIAKIDYAAIENVVSYPWSGAMFSDRLWQNKQALLFNTREVLTQGLIQGKSVNVMSSALAAKWASPTRTPNAWSGQKPRIFTRNQIGPHTKKPASNNMNSWRRWKSEPVTSAEAWTGNTSKSAKRKSVSIIRRYTRIVGVLR